MFCRSIWYLILLVIISPESIKVAETEVECENIMNARSDIICEMRESTSIESADVRISNYDEIVTWLTLSINKKIHYLPVKVAESFPNLVEYWAHNSAIKKISKMNFESLTQLKVLLLQGNEIQEIPSDTFEDLTSLKTLYLSK